MAKIHHKQPEGPIRPHHPPKGAPLSEAVINRSEKVAHASNQCFVRLRVTFAPQKKSKLASHHVSFPSTAPERGR